MHPVIDKHSIQFAVLLWTVFPEQDVVPLTDRNITGARVKLSCGTKKQQQVISRALHSFDYKSTGVAELMCNAVYMNHKNTS